VLGSEHTIIRNRRKRKLEAVKFWRKRKRFDKISWKRKRSRKRPTLSGSGSKKSQEWESKSELGSMTLQEELEAETKTILPLLHPWCEQLDCYSAGSALSNLRLVDSWLGAVHKKTYAVSRSDIFRTGGYSDVDVRTFCCKNQHQIF